MLPGLQPDLASVAAWGNGRPGVLKYQCAAISPQDSKKETSSSASKKDQTFGPISRLLRKISHFLMSLPITTLALCLLIGHQLALDQLAIQIRKPCVRTQLHIILINQNTLCSVQLTLCRLPEDRYLVGYGTKLPLQKFYRNFSW